jgi:3-hydroxybutyryl-CoA dehydratase
MTVHRRYADVVVGEVFPPEPARFEVSDAVVAALADATGSEARHDARLAPPELAVIYLTPVLQARGGRPGGVHARQSLAFHRAVHVGDVLFTQGRVTGKYEKKGRNYVVSQTQTHDAEGRLVTTGVTTGIWGPE